MTTNSLMEIRIPELYREMVLQTKALTTDEPNLIANLANVSALIFNRLDRLNWSGFYLREGNELVLGPFQGKPACVRIPWGKGVCGTAASMAKTQRIDDVHAFDGHIACDAESVSELVIPIIRDAQVVAVLDIDSPEPKRFSEQDQHGFEALVDVIAPLFTAPEPVEIA